MLICSPAACVAQACTRPPCWEPNMHPADDYRLAVRLQLEYDRHMQLVDRGRGFQQDEHLPRPATSQPSHSSSARRLDFGAYASDEYVFDDRPARAAGASSSGALGRSASGSGPSGSGSSKERREKKDGSSRDKKDSSGQRDNEERKPRKKADAPPSAPSGGSRTSKSALKLQNPAEAVWERERITAPSRSGFSGLSSAMDRMMLSGGTCAQDVDKYRSISSSGATTGTWTDVRQTAYAYAPAPASSTYYQRRTEHYQVTSAEPEPVRPSATTSQVRSSVRASSPRRATYPAPLRPLAPPPLSPIA